MVDERLRAAELLRVLKFFYSFNELSAVLGIPGQVLWRYASMRVVPERCTARRIVEAVESGLLPRLYRELPVGPASLQAPLNPGVVELAAMDCAEWCRERLGRIDHVACIGDPWGSALGAAIARMLKTRLLILPAQPVPVNGYTAEAWSCGPRGPCGVILAPRGHTVRGGRLLLAAFIAWCRAEAEAAAGLLRRQGYSVAGIYAYTAPAGSLPEPSRILKPWSHPP